MDEVSVEIGASTRTARRLSTKAWRTRPLLPAVSLYTFSFCLALAIWLVSCILYQTSLEACISLELKMAKLLSLAICLGAETLIVVSYGKRDVFQIFILGFMALGAMCAKTSIIFQAAIFLFCSRRVDINTVLTCFGWSLALTSVLVYALYSLDLIESVDLIESSVRTARSSMGFVWPSRLPTLFFAVVLTYLCVVKDRASLSVLLVLFVLNIWIYSNTNSRNPFLLTGFVLFIAFCRCVGGVDKNRKWSYRWLIVLAPLCLIVSIAAPLAYDPSNESWKMLDDLLAHRLKFSSLGMNSAHLSLFGMADFADQSTRDSFVDGYFDSGYLSLLFGFGAVPTIIILSGYIYVIVCADKTQDFYVMLSACMVLGFSLLYSHMLISLFYNPMMFYFPYYIKEIRSVRRRACQS